MLIKFLSIYLTQQQQYFVTVKTLLSISKSVVVLIRLHCRSGVSTWENIHLHTCMETFCYSCGVNKISCAQTANHMGIQVTDSNDNLNRKTIHTVNLGRVNLIL